MSEMLEETGRYRVRVEHEAAPHPPYDDGGSPILRYETGYGYDSYTTEQLTDITTYKVDDRIVEALTRWGDDGHAGRGSVPNFERYLRMFHGATEVVWRDDYHGDYKYVTFDTAHWRERQGLTDDYLARMRAQGYEMRLADMDEYCAYLDGEVYGYILEEKVTWQRLGSDGEPVFMVDEPTRETWEVVDSCWGFYGHEYAEEAARQELDAYIENDDA